MKVRAIPNRRFIFLVAVFAFFGSIANAEILYVDDTNGNDAYPGTEDKPLRSIAQAAAMVNKSNEPGPTIIRIKPGA
jgi:hypothetical protein